MNTCLNCGAPIDDLSYYCWDCKHGMKDERDSSNPSRDAAQICKDAPAEKIQDVNQQASEETQHTFEQNLADTLGRLQTHLYLARRGMQRSGLIFLGGALLTIGLYLVADRYTYLFGIVPVIFGITDCFRNMYRYFKAKKDVAEFKCEHIFLTDNKSADSEGF